MDVYLGINSFVSSRTVETLFPMIFLPPLRLPCIINKLSSLPDLSLTPGNALPGKGYDSARALPLLIASSDLAGGQLVSSMM